MNRMAGAGDLRVEDIASDDEDVLAREAADRPPPAPNPKTFTMARYTLHKLPPKLALQKVAKTLTLKQSERYFFLAQFTAVITVSFLIGVGLVWGRGMCVCVCV